MAGTDGKARTLMREKMTESQRLEAYRNCPVEGADEVIDLNAAFFKELFLTKPCE